MDHPDLSWIQRSPQMLSDAADAALKAKRQHLDGIIAIPAEQRTFLNTIGAMQYADELLADLQQQADLIINVHPDATVRDGAQAVADRIDEENITMEYDRRLWRAVQEWSANAEVLQPADRKLAEDIIRDMKRMGFALDDTAFEELKRLVTELKKESAKFEKAINDWEDHIEVTREQLAGMPDRYIDGLQRSGDMYLVSLEYPELHPFMRQADDADARKTLAAKNLRKGGDENMARLARLITMRQRVAAMLGYASHVDYACEVRMAHDGRTVTAFLADLIMKLMPAARHELVDLIDIKKRTQNLEKRAPVHFHEITYWGHRLLKERHDIDSESLKEYFPFAVVMQGMLGIYQDVLGVTFVPVDDAVLWHPDARLYAMREGNRVIGHFAFDMFPRKGKYGHAATYPVVLGRENADGSTTTGLLALVCNFPNPTDADPSLLSHDEVETLFHEFGHVCHALVSGGRWQRQNGFGVALDFVETPSQLFEEWAWEPSVLKRITKHYKTGDPIPDELITKLLGARHHMEANYYLQQAVRALYDVRMHSLPAGTMVEPSHLAQMYRDMKLQYEAIDLPDDAIMAAGWSHMADYDAGYYSYLWSKVYALDLYSVFKPQPLSASVGKRYKDIILAPGASRPEMDLVTEFLGREPSNTSFLEALGISQKLDNSA
jgi:thimet oligopeptidase